MIRLSICIATYNRSDYIGETLDSIIPQLTEEVEIVVLDGASTDKTSAVIEEYQQKCSQLNYVKLPLKGGVDHDYCKAVEHAQGQMCWLFPDDDLLSPGSIKCILDEIDQRYSLIVVNSKVMDCDFARTLNAKLLNVELNEIYKTDAFEELFVRVIPYMSFIGCVVVDRELWMSREKTRYFGTEFIHIGVIFQAPLPSPALIISEPFIRIRYGNAKWTKRSFEIWKFKWPNLLVSFEAISDEVIETLRFNSHWQHVKDLIILRAKGSYSFSEFKKWIQLKDTWYISSFLVSIIPGPILNIVLLTYYKMLRRSELITLHDLLSSKFNMFFKSP